MKKITWARFEREDRTWGNETIYTTPVSDKLFLKVVIEEEKANRFYAQVFLQSLSNADLDDEKILLSACWDNPKLETHNRQTTEDIHNAFKAEAINVLKKHIKSISTYFFTTPTNQ